MGIHIDYLMDYIFVHYHRKEWDHTCLYFWKFQEGKYKHKLKDPKSFH